MPASLVALFGGNTWLAITTGEASAIVNAIALTKWQQKPVLVQQRRGQQIHDSDVACLAYYGDTSPQARIEVAIKSMQSQQATLVE